MTKDTQRTETPAQPEEPSLDNFESAVKKLEEIVDKLGDQSLPLDQAMTIFEQGIKVSQTCARYLNEARVRVEKLIEEAPGVFNLEAFDQVENTEDVESKDAKKDDSGGAR